MKVQRLSKREGFGQMIVAAGCNCCCCCCCCNCNTGGGGGTVIIQVDTLSN